MFAALLSWIDGIGETGLAGHDLGGLGLKNGNLTVDDERTGKHWAFKDINLSAERLHGGGVEVAVGSDNPSRPWALTASVAPSRQGFRRFQLEARHVSISDLLLASRLDDRSITIDTPLSASVSGEIGPDGLPQVLSGRVLADAGSLATAMVATAWPLIGPNSNSIGTPAPASCRCRCKFCPAATASL